MYKIVWAAKAKNNLEHTLKYWLNRNKSNSYPKKIVNDVIAKEDLLLANPFLGEETNYKGIRRVLILRNFSLFYAIEENSKEIRMITFRDNRKNPKF